MSHHVTRRKTMGARASGAAYRVRVDALRTIRWGHAEEAQDGETKADFIAKLAISRKESRESRYWLRVAIRLKKVTNEEVAWK